jgi:hypothetical protein
MKVKPGAVLTVGGGVTLTLRNITFEGVADNTTPLLKAGAGGKLILEDGVKLINNKTTADAGGVWVNNGVLILNDGVEITGMAARRGGGVLVDALGNFIMNGGTIGKEDSGNTASQEQGGGGVLVASGSFDMNGGIIQGNSAAALSSGGGVCVLQKGTFNLNLGTIKENTTRGSNSGGGVCVISDYDMVNFIMNGGGAFIENNTAKEAYSGGGVYCYGGNFSINRGIITHNEAQGEHSGGGVFAKNGKLNGGTIRANYASAGSSGAGIYVAAGEFNFLRGEITSNIAQEAYSGGGVYIADGKFEHYEGDLKGNIAQEAHSGGGVYVAGGSFSNLTIPATLVIEGNTASGADSGGGAYIAGGFFNPRGEIRGNFTPGMGYNCGVYVKSTSYDAFYMIHDAKVADDNLVFLSSGAMIHCSTLYASAGETVATIIHENPIDGITRLLWTYGLTAMNDHINKFHYAISPGYIDSTAVQGTGGDTYWYGIYKE